MPQLDTTNPDHFIYQNDLLRIEILGGIKIEGLDRLRATLKAALPESPRPPIRHNLDLYNDNQLEKFIRKAAQKLELGTSVIAASLSEITAQLEGYRLEQLKKQQPEEEKPKPLSQKAKEQAKAYASKPQLVKRTMSDLQQTGIIGETTNSMILHIAMSSRQCPDPLSVICLARSGAGKSYLMEKVAACFPTEDLLENTQFTENSFYYFKREEIRGKVFLVEDLDGAQAVLYPIRELQSKKRISKTVTMKDKSGQLRTITLIVEGPVSVIGCTTKEKIYEDNANRSILIYLDNSKEQDHKILDYQKKLKANLIDKNKETQLREKLQNVQRILQPVKIVNPYALLIDLPKEVFKPRRTMGLLLNFIEAITFYHQHQREQQADKETGEVFIETTPEDIQWAFKLLRETLFRKSDELSGACRSFYEWVRSPDRQFKNRKFYASDIRKEKRIAPRTLQRYLKELTEYNRLKIVGGKKHGNGYQYELNPKPENENLPGVIDEQISKVLKAVEAEHKKRQGTKRKRKK
ncbi:hypothetical protein [Salibacter halophilus]|uniref:DNA primase n=1 Tax=Salibacter halophilus TaxID=1803916 RepID=A0A6N6M3Y1_9FLAO|nr:hypothetical protein [Salibacter halophilus]KAB1061470.1 hypothetical protein F3059_13515 [Salibacter halophilus]